MIAVDDLLTPTSASPPCGVDLAGDQEYLDIEAALRSYDSDPTKEPDWVRLQRNCLSLLGKGKDLRVAVALALTSLQVNGLTDFRDALLAICGLLDRYWDEMHPRLDAELDHDPGERIGVLGALCLKQGTDRDPWKFQERLRKAPLFHIRGTGYSARDLERAKTGADDNPLLADLAGALAQADPEDLQSNRQALEDAIRIGPEIEALLQAKVGDQAGSWSVLIETLQELQYRISPDGDVPGGREKGLPFASESRAGADGAVVSGVRVESRQDVKRMLQHLCDYYARAEPSSPLPMLLRRAMRLVDMDFLEIAADLVPDALPEVRKLAGIKIENV